MAERFSVADKKVWKDVRSTGLEPVPVAGHAPQTCAYAYSATTARTDGII